MSQPLVPEQRERLEQLFDRAADLPRGERAAFVERECGADGPLRDELSRLLEGLEGEDHLQARMPGAPSRAGTRVGPYRLLERIGEGGMGEVYAAEQLEPVKRRVALKVVKPGMDSAQVLARFEAERQALARMTHPNVAQVYDGGATEDGRPYFVMELVDGPPITGWCDRQGLPTRARLELFLGVCDGVQHAHQKGIIHRDLKPSNLLVTEQDGRGVAKVIDFGVARATTGRLAEQSLHTLAGQVVGTLDYMSPEQADPGGDVDTRTDVYSLGVVLYQLVSGLLPFESATKSGRPLSEVQRAIREQDPPTPSTRLRRQARTATAIAPLHGTDGRTLIRQLSGDLDWICLKALEKDPARRYASVSELAQDVRRHLADEPVLAGRPGALYRARKFARRHRLAVTAGVLVLAAAGAGVAGLVSGRLETLARERVERAFAGLEDDRAVLLLEARADDELWPPYPALIGELESWLEDARALDGRLATHERELEALRAAARPWKPEQRQRDRETHPKAAELAGMRAELEALAANLDSNLPEEELQAVDDRIQQLERQVSALAAEVSTGRTWRFDSPVDQVRHDVLEEHIARWKALRPALLDEGTITSDHGWSVPKRLAFAKDLQSGFAEGGPCAEAWEDALERIRGNEHYAGSGLEKLTPQMGLLPLGPDPETGLEEFAHLQTGEPARRRADGTLEVTEGTGLVLVLIPSGSFWMGSQGDDPNGHNYDPVFHPYYMEGNPEEPVLKRTVKKAFFLSKYEMTRGQWRALTNDVPITQKCRWDTGSLLFPVDNVSWHDGTWVMRQAGLALPTEEQWEYAARAGEETPWWTGEKMSSLVGAASVLSGAEAEDHPEWMFLDPPKIQNLDNYKDFDDGIRGMAEVVAERQNAFGLHYVHGNVAEWCRTPTYPYQGFYKRLVEAGIHSVEDLPIAFARGGRMRFGATYCRSAARVNGRKEGAQWTGLRPARAIVR